VVCYLNVSLRINDPSSDSVPLSVASCYHGLMDDFETFARLVHEVYPHLHDRVFLQEHHLLRLVGGPSAHGAERLHRTLIDALEWLRPLGTVSPSSAEWRRYRHLQLRYVEGASPEHIARDLQVSPRQARRDHAEALDEVARLLWTRLVRPPSSVSTDIAPAAPPPPPRGENRATSLPGDSLDAEISSLTIAAPATPCDVGEIIAGVLETISRLAEANDVRIEVKAPESLEPIAVNRTVLRQLLLNVLSDAIVNHPDSSIEIQVTRHERLLDIAILVTWPLAPCASDNGAEIGDDQHRSGISPAVFEVSQRLARSLDASLESNAESRRVTLHLTLPAVRAKTLLLVDDNPDVALLFRRYLQDANYRLVQARSAERALRLARELQPDVVILDVLMPSHDGWEILQALRAEPTTALLPIVICSVLPDHALALSLGVSDFLRKPVTRQALLDVLERLHPRLAAVVRQDRRESSDTTRPRATRPPD
jgi:CheY-like chemotaxis protein